MVLIGLLINDINRLIDSITRLIHGLTRLINGWGGPAGTHKWAEQGHYQLSE